MLNKRFYNGVASNDLAAAGVVVHCFDTSSNPIRAGLDLFRGCATTSSQYFPGAACADRISASIISEKLPEIYGGCEKGGLILAPDLGNVFCSYFNDGGTMQKFCGKNAPAGCVPGCADTLTSKPNWCDGKQALNIAADIYSCAFRPNETYAMLQHHIKFGGAYNEVVINANRWRSRLPDGLDGIFFRAGGDEKLARAVHRTFSSTYHSAMRSKRALPLLRLDWPPVRGLRVFTRVN